VFRVIRPLSLFLAGILTSTSLSADWPEFRGPTGQGVSDETKLPTTWSDKENIAWKIAVPGVAWSSPVIVDGRIYLTTAVEVGEDEKKEELKFLILDEKTGKLIREQRLFEHPAQVEIHNKNSHASPTPIVADGVVYVHFGPHGTAALSTDGELIWENTEIKYGPTHGNGGSPALSGDTLVICCDGHDEQFVVGLDRKTGKVRWKTPRDTEPTKGFSFSTPLIITINGQPQAVCPGSDAVFAYEPATGKEIWRVRYDDGYSVVPRPVYAGGLVFVCTGYNKAKLIAIDPTGTGDVTSTHLKWTLEKGAPHNPSVVASGTELFLVSDGGIASCVDIASGEVNWQERLGGKYSASPLAANGLIYFQDEEGTAIVVKAGKTFEKVAENHFVDDERTFASYAVDQGSLFIRSEHHLFRVTDGAQLQTSVDR
jgi:outer membrane protein assembly factor BamB